MLQFGTGMSGSRKRASECGKSRVVLTHFSQGLFLFPEIVPDFGDDL